MSYIDKSMIARYQRASHLMTGIWTQNVVRNATIFPTWIRHSDQFWYERELKFGREYRLVDAKRAVNQKAFDHQVLAETLAEISGQQVNSDDLPITEVDITVAPLQVAFTAFEKRWSFSADSSTCIEIDKVYRDWVVSPDGRKAIFARDYNLWIRDIVGASECQLTYDGEEDYAYGCAGSSWGVAPGSITLQVLWSPNSRNIFTVQRDRRRVKNLPVVHHVPDDNSIRPSVEFVKVAYPGDEFIETLRLITIDVSKRHCRDVEYPQIPVTRNDWGLFSSNLGWWAKDSRRGYFVDVERDYKTASLVEFQADTGVTKILFQESSRTQVNLMLNADELPTLMPLPETGELLWFSERSGWAHLYLYNLETGELKNPVTEGKWLVRDLVSYNPERREVFIQTGGRVGGRDPYYRDLVRVNIDTGVLTAIASSDHEYIAVGDRNHNKILMSGLVRDVADSRSVSDSGRFAVVTKSRADEVPVSLLLDRNGNQILELEIADVTGLPDGWEWPEPVKLLGADGHTEIYGLVFRPSDFSPDQAYPVISHVFATPDMPWVAKGSFSNGIFLGMSYFDAAALAELGFIVIQIDSRGSSYRSKAFQDESYGCQEAACNLDDYVAGIQQLAELYPYIDVNRVGITTHIGGGPGAVQGLLEYPDFYKVGVSGFFHDSRLIAANMMGEKYEGLKCPPQDEQYPENKVGRLVGKLLLMHGMIDRCTPPAGTFRIVEALQKSNKDFDLILLPNFEHDVSGYLIRRAWDYLVRNLLESEPPKEFRLSISCGDWSEKIEI